MQHALPLSVYTVKVDVKHSQPLQADDDAAALALGGIVVHERAGSRTFSVAPQSVKTNKPLWTIEDCPNCSECGLPRTVEYDGPGLGVFLWPPIDVASPPPESHKILLRDWAGKTSCNRASSSSCAAPKCLFNIDKDGFAHKRALWSQRRNCTLALRSVSFGLFAGLVHAPHQLV